MVPSSPLCQSSRASLLSSERIATQQQSGAAYGRLAILLMTARMMHACCFDTHSTPMLPPMQGC